MYIISSAMKKLIALSLFAVFLFLLLGLLTLPQKAKAQRDIRVPGQILVKFKRGTSQQEMDKQINSNRASILKRIDKLDVLVLKVPEAVQDMIVSALSRNPNVEFAEL